MGKECFLCTKQLGALSLKMTVKEIERKKVSIPSGMSDDDRICNDCFIAVTNKDPKKAQDADLMKHTEEYKKNWNKNGIVQFKNERIAILQRMWGSQVQFIVAYDQLTKEGYRLMSIDEGKEGGQASGGFTGGVNAYFYFQNMKYVK